MEIALVSQEASGERKHLGLVDRTAGRFPQRMKTEYHRGNLKGLLRWSALSDFFKNLQRALQHIGRASQSGVELLKGRFPLAVTLERLEPADLIFKNCGLGLQYEIFSGQRHGKLSLSSYGS